MSSSSVKNQVDTVISESQDFAIQKETSSFDIQLAEGTEKAKQSAISQAEASVQMLEMQTQETKGKLSPPPMKDQAAGGKSGGTIQVVDNEEVAKLESQLKAQETQLASAKSKADTARSEATEATTRRIQAQSNEADAASKEEAALSKASSLRASIAGEERTEDDGPISDKLSGASPTTEAVSATANVTNANATEGTKDSNEGETTTARKVNETTASTSSNTD